MFVLVLNFELRVTCFRRIVQLRIYFVSSRVREGAVRPINLIHSCESLKRSRGKSSELNNENNRLLQHRNEGTTLLDLRNANNLNIPDLEYEQHNRSRDARVLASSFRVQSRQKKGLLTLVLALRQRDG